MDQPEIQFPDKLKCLFEPARYKVLYGGRGGAKSWGIARALIILASSKPLRILCAREFQNSIADSVHKLLSDQIDALGLGGSYEIQKSAIIGADGSEFVFAGIRNNVTKIKSYEAVDIVWVEEAQTVSKASWETLIPTIRKPGSEIWLSFNPELESDETYQRFVKNPPPSAVVQKVNWSDNPWFPSVLHDEMLLLKERDPDSYLTIWEGHTRQALDGAVYAKELREATEQGRICKVPYDHSKPVHTFWDLGHADKTCIWMAQIVGFETRVIDYYDNCQQPLTHYLQELQKRPYVWGTDWLPHDARAKQLGTGKSIEELARAAGRKVQIVPQIGVDNGINAARTAFPNCWFDADKCADGIQSLRHYRYETDTEAGALKKAPLHDWASHAADAFRYLAVALKSDKPGRKVGPSLPPVGFVSPGAQNTGWMRN